MTAASTVDERLGSRPRPSPEHVTSADIAFEQSGLTRMLGPGEGLFRAGDVKRHVYRVIQGLLGNVETSAGPAPAQRKIVGFCIPGEILGLGALDRHAQTVEALGPSIVQCLPRHALDDVLARDAVLAARHAEATEVELGLMRDRLVQQGRSNALARVAALLGVLSANNGYEGRRRDVIDDDISCGFVAERLGLDVGALETTLRELARRGLIHALPGGALRIIDSDGLEAVASSA